MPSHVILTLSLAGHASFKCGVGTLEASAIALNLAEATFRQETKGNRGSRAIFLEGLQDNPYEAKS
jgi:hypothetical protein